LRDLGQPLPTCNISALALAQQWDSVTKTDKGGPHDQPF
jgi:hypothetical protein